MTISNTYKEKWRVKFAYWYTVSECGKVLNSRKGTQIKEIYKNGMHGYYIQGKFWSKKNLRGHLELIPKQEHTPF